MASHRPFGKVISQNYDDLLSTEDRSLSFCLSERTAKMLLAMTDYLHWQTRYFSLVGTEIDQETINDWASVAERELILGLGGCCGQPPEGALLRLTIAGVVQISLDNGATWADAPEFDPRINPPEFLPLQTGISDTTRCAAADNIVMMVRGLQAEVEGVLVLSEMVEVVAEFLALFLSGGILSGLVIPLAGILTDAAAGALNTAMTDDVYDQLRCCCYCNIGNDGKVSDWDGLTDCIYGSFDNLAYTFLISVFQILGEGGITNAGRTGSGVGDDCGDCDCDCIFTENYTTLGLDWSGGTETLDGFCGIGRYIDSGGTTFTIPNRGSRQVVGVVVPICDATIGGGVTVTVTVGGTAALENPQDISVGHVFTFASPIVSGVVHIHTNTGKNVFVTGVTIQYAC